MTESSETAPKVHYICQTYVQKKAGGSGQSGTQIGKQFQYATAAQAEDRAERESRLEDCVGADAYMIIEDAETGEVGLPTFIARFGTVPEADDY